MSVDLYNCKYSLSSLQAQTEISTSSVYIFSLSWIDSPCFLILPSLIWKFELIKKFVELLIKQNLYNHQFLIIKCVSFVHLIWNNICRVVAILHVILARLNQSTIRPCRWEKLKWTQKTWDLNTQLLKIHLSFSENSARIIKRKQNSVNTSENFLCPKSSSLFPEKCYFSHFREFLTQSIERVAKPFHNSVSYHIITLNKHVIKSCTDLRKVLFLWGPSFLAMIVYINCWYCTKISARCAAIHVWYPKYVSIS